MGLLDTLLVVWATLGIPVALAAYGHLMGSTIKSHPLDKLIIAGVLGAAWPYILYTAIRGRWNDNN